MPIARINSSLVYYAHVPKCAGSGIENYLTKRFGKLGFLDRGQMLIEQDECWTACSPQHIDTISLDRLLPPSFFSDQFAVVRHPLRRILSVFRFQRDIERKIPFEKDLDDWLDELPEQSPFYLDNHTRPANQLVPEEATVFKLEQGLEPLIKWIDQLAGDEDGPREIPMFNTYASRLVEIEAEAGPKPVVTDSVLEKVGRLYREDFDRFGYDLEPAGTKSKAS